MPEQIGYINGTPIANGIGGDACALPVIGTDYHLVLTYDTAGCMWVYQLQEIVPPVEA